MTEVLIRPEVTQSNGKEADPITLPIYRPLLALQAGLYEVMAKVEEQGNSLSIVEQDELVKKLEKLQLGIRMKYNSQVAYGPGKEALNRKNGNGHSNGTHSEDKNAGLAN